MGIIQPYLNRELVLGHHDGVVEIAATHKDADVSSCRR